MLLVEKEFAPREQRGCCLSQWPYRVEGKPVRLPQRSLAEASRRNQLFISLFYLLKRSGANQRESPVLLVPLESRTAFRNRDELMTSVRESLYRRKPRSERYRAGQSFLKKHVRFLTCDTHFWGPNYRKGSTWSHHVTLVPRSGTKKNVQSSCILHFSFKREKIEFKNTERFA